MRAKPKNFRKNQALRLLQKDFGAAGFSAQAISSSGAQGQIGAVEVNKEHLKDCQELWNKDKIKKSDPMETAKHVASSPYRDTHKMVDQVALQIRADYKGSKANPKAIKPHKQWTMRHAQRGNKVHSTQVGDTVYLSAWKSKGSIAKSEKPSLRQAWASPSGKVSTSAPSPDRMNYIYHSDEPLYHKHNGEKHFITDEHVAHHVGFIGVGHAGHFSVSGATEHVFNPSHPANKAARAFVSEHVKKHPEITHIDVSHAPLKHVKLKSKDSTDVAMHHDFDNDELKNFSMKHLSHDNDTAEGHKKIKGSYKSESISVHHWIKHGTRPSKLARFHKGEPLNKESFDQTPAEWEKVKGAHGWINPKGKFYEMSRAETHVDHINRDHKMDPSSAHKKGWLAIGHGGKNSVSGHEDTLLDPGHPATKTARKLIAEHHGDKTNVQLVHHSSAKEYDEWNEKVETVPTDHWVKHGTVPKSKLALFRSNEPLNKISHAGWISPKGNFHDIGDQLHEEWSEKKTGRKGNIHMYDAGWLSVGHDGESNLAGHVKVLDNPSHPAVKAARKLAEKSPASHIEIERIDDKYRGGDMTKVPTEHYIKHGTVPKSKLALFRSIGEKLRTLKKEMYSIDTETKSHHKKAHGWVTPEGKFHKLEPHIGHFEWIREKQGLGRKEAHDKGWLVVGSAGQANVWGNAKYLHNPDHPATKKARELAGKHFVHGTVELNSTEGHTNNISTDHWHKHGTVPKSKLALFRSVGEKLGELRKEMWNKAPGYKEHMRPFHGVISHEGKFHQMKDNELHTDKMLGHATEQAKKQKLPLADAYSEMPKKGWIQMGLAGRPEVAAHSAVIHDHTHKSTKALANKVKELAPHVEHVRVNLLDLTHDTGYQSYDVPRHMAEKGRFKKPSKMQMFKSEETHIDLVHYSPKRLTEISPMRHGKGVKGADRRYKGEPDYQPRSYHYTKGTKPEHLVAASTKYKHHTKVEAKHVYDAGKDKHGYAKQVKDKNQGAFRMPAFETKVKEAGFKGYKVDDVVAMFHPVKPHTVEEHTDRPMKKSDTSKSSFNPVHHNDFHGTVSSVRGKSERMKDNVHLYDKKDYAKMKTFMSPDKKSGYAVKQDGDLVNVFSTEKGRGSHIVSHAIKNGATKLDAFDGHLTKLYAKHGFKEHKREKHWEKGKPDVVYMKLDQSKMKKSGTWDVISVDFDDTIADVNFPQIKGLKTGVKEALQRLKDAGYKIVVCSARNNTKISPDSGKFLLDMKAFLDQENVPYDEIDDGKSGKPAADYYIDDKGVRFLDNWNDIANAIIRKNEDEYQFKHNPNSHPNVHTIQAFHEGKKIGHVIVSSSSDSKGYHGVEVGHVHPDHRGRGVYQGLLHTAKEFVQSKGSKGLKSEGYQRSKPADNAWKRVHTDKKEEKEKVWVGQKQPSGKTEPVLRDKTETNYFLKEDVRKNDPIQTVMDFDGISAMIEWPRGSVRAYKDGYSKKMKASYGYLEDVMGDDGEELDVYVGTRPESKLVFIVKQMKKKTGKYDEQKVMLHYESKEAALEAYKYHMPDQPIGGIEEISWDQLVDMVERKEKDRLQGEEKPDGERHIVKSISDKLRLLKAKMKPFKKRELDLNLGYKIRTDKQHERGMTVVAEDKEGTEVGRTNLLNHWHSSDEMSAVNIQVHRNHRRQGIASAMYEHAEKETGKKMRPGTAQWAAGKALWDQKDRKFGKSDRLFMKRELDPKEGYKLSHTFRSRSQFGDFKPFSGEYKVHAHDKEGNKVGTAYIYPFENKHGKRAVSKDIEVKEGHRRKGIASAMYQHFENVSGHKLHPDTILLHRGRKLWSQKDRKFGAPEVKDDKRFGKSDAIREKLLLLKGAMQRLAPVKSKISSEETEAVKEWVDLGYARDRSGVPKMTAPHKKRALHKLHGLTPVRRDKQSSKREFLLHRGVPHDEYQDVNRGSHVHMSSNVSWTPHKKVAKHFANKYKDEFTGKKGKVISAWIPEAKIKHIPHAIGEGKSAKHKGEHEVITHSDLKATKHEA